MKNIDKMTYENRVIAFIDILGFKEILNQTVDKDDAVVQENVDLLLEAYKSIRDVWDLDKMKVKDEDYKNDTTQITIFSDCIVLSFPLKEPSKIFFTLLEIKWMVMRLISKGILCRGGIAYGKLIHNETVLFGPALVEAYILESKAANYPRIILDRSIIELAGVSAKFHSADDEMKYIESILEKDLDGMYYIDYFTKAQEELDDPLYDFPKYIQLVGDKIRQGMNASKHPSKVDIRVKYNWMKEKYNRMVEKVTRKETFEFLTKQGEIELLEFYKKLTKINPYSKTNIDKLIKRNDERK